jgi:hypothetical protein
VRQGRDHGCRRPEHVDHDGNSPCRGPGRHAMKDVVAGLERECLLKDNVYKEMRAESIFKIDFLKKQIGDLSNRCSDLEKDVATSDENIKLLKVRF